MLQLEVTDVGSTSEPTVINASSLLEGLVSDLQETQDLDDLRSAFYKRAQELGMKYFTYHIVKIAGLGTHLPYVITNYPDDWVLHYIEQDYVKVDPLVSAGPSLKLPFEWNKVAAGDQLQGKQVKLYKEAADLNIEQGMSVPIHGTNGEFAMMSVVPDAKGAEAHKLLQEQMAALNLLSLYYHNHASGQLIQRMNGATRRKAVLTAREREVLQWTAVGKSTWDISQILSIAENSVVFHIENAKRKLGVTNRTHAVVKAIMLRLISLA